MLDIYIIYIQIQLMAQGQFHIYFPFMMFWLSPTCQAFKLCFSESSVILTLPSNTLLAEAMWSYMYLTNVQTKLNSVKE